MNVRPSDDRASIVDVPRETAISHVPSAACATDGSVSDCPVKLIDRPSEVKFTPSLDSAMQMR